MPKQKPPIIYEDDEIYECPYNYDEELAQLESASKKKLKRVK